MKKYLFWILAVLVCFVFFGRAANAGPADDISVHKACKYCGMDRGMHNFSRMLIEYDDGSNTAFCSLHCAAVDLANNIDKMPRTIKVADFNGKQLIDAEKAFWVVGGSKPGVMTKRGKWAFAEKDDAENYKKMNQGQVVSFEEAMRMAYEDMHDDTKAIRERRQMKRMKMMEQQPHAGHS